MRAGIILLSLGVGGTEKRLSTLFAHLSAQAPSSYYLVATERLVRLLHRQNILQPGKQEIHLVRTIPRAIGRLPATAYSGFYFWRRALAKALDEANAIAPTDVYHYGIPFSYFIAPARYRRFAVIEAMGSTLQWRFEVIIRAAAKKGAVVNCLSRPIRDSLAARLPESATARLMLSPGSLLPFHAASLPLKQRQIAFVGRFESVKNPLLFVEAIGILSRRTRDFRAVMLGDGRLRVRVERRIAQLGLREILQCAFDDSPGTTLARSMVFASLQQMDNYPSQSLLEAMESGCAIVATDVGCTADLVNRETGILVPFDPEAIANAFDRLLADPDTTKSMGERARRLVRQRHGLDQYATYIEGLYGNATSSGSPYS